MYMKTDARHAAQRGRAIPVAGEVTAAATLAPASTSPGTVGRLTTRKKLSQGRSLISTYSLLRWILPETVFGSSSLKTTMRGYLYGAVWAFT